MPRDSSRHVTLREVSNLAKVSPMSASRVLNSRAKVKESTRRAVLKAARELGYTTNALARAMRTGRTGNIGVLLPPSEPHLKPSSSAYYLHMLEGLEMGLLGKEYNVLVSTVTFDEIAKRQVPKVVASRYVDGVIFLNLADGGYVQAMADRLRNVVGLHMRLAEGYPCVHASNHEAGRKVAHHFWELGHRKVGVVTLLARPNQRERSDGFIQTIQQLGGEVAFVIDVSDWDDSNFLHVETWLPVFPDARKDDAKKDARAPAGTSAGAPALPTALLCSNDGLAARIRRLVQQAGLTVPADLSIAGFEAYEMALDASAPLTTVDFDKREMSWAAVELMEALLSGQPPAQLQVAVPVRLMPRGSTAPPRQP